MERNKTTLAFERTVKQTRRIFYQVVFCLLAVLIYIKSTQIHEKQPLECLKAVLKLVLKRKMLDEDASKKDGEQNKTNFI